MATDRSDETLRLRATLATIAPGTPMRDGLDRILRGRTGALIVLGHDKVVESIATGGFTLDVPFTATGLRELAKMDGAIILDKDVTRILRAAVHLMPDHTIPSEETGTRHRTADRVARQTGFPVISVSQSMQIIAAYVGETRHVLEDSGQILSRANQALATLERYKLRLDEVSSTLSALEIEDLVTVRDVAVVAQRLEMVTRIASEIEDYVLELGTDGRLLSLQLEELITGVDTERELVIRDYLPAGRRSKTPEALLEPARVAVLDRAGRPRRRRPRPRARQRRAPRRRGRAARLPAAGQGPAAASHRRRPAGRPLRHPAEAALRRRRRPPGRRRRRRAARPQRARGPVPPRRVDDPRALRLGAGSLSRGSTLPRTACRRACSDGVTGRPVGLGCTVLVIVAAVGATSSNCRSDGSPPSAAAVTWYQPGIAQVVNREQSSSERLPAPTITPTLVVTALRTTTSRTGIAFGQSWLDQTSSSPEVIDIVERVRRDPPGAGLGHHGPQLEDDQDVAAGDGVLDLRRDRDVGAGAVARRHGQRRRRVAAALVFFFLPGFGGLAGRRRLGDRRRADVEVVATRPAPPGPRRTSASLPSPSSRAIANTSSTAVPSTRSRRTQ